MRMPVADRREALAAAATRVLARDGIDGVTARAVVAEANMSLASLHYAFPSISDLLRTVVEEDVSEVREALLASLEVGETSGRGREALRHTLLVALASHLDRIERDDGTEQGMFELSFRALRTPALAPIAKWKYERFCQVVTEAMDVAAAEAGMRWRQPSDDIARLVIALCDGIALGSFVDRQVSWPLLEHIVEAVVDLAEEIE